jgi:hypothetical protein
MSARELTVLAMRPQYDDFIRAEASAASPSDRMAPPSKPKVMRIEPSAGPNGSAAPAIVSANFQVNSAGQMVRTAAPGFRSGGGAVAAGGMRYVRTTRIFSDRFQKTCFPIAFSIADL